ncbi:MAG: sugar ABC transporter permease [Bacillota bacterium]|nr:sugar ABC transporter permease [Bacillota bacterium]
MIGLAPPKPRKRQMTLERRTPALMVTPAVALLLLLTLFPMFYSLFLSLHDWNMARPQHGRTFIGLGNFSRLLNDPYFWEALGRTAVYVVGAVTLQMVIGFALALLFSSRTRFVSVSRALLLFPVMLSPIVVGVMWRILYHPSFGMVNFATSFLGLGTRAWLGDPKTAMLAIILTEVWQWSPFVMLLVQSGLAGLPPEPFEAALIDGASSWQAFWRITVPLVSPTLITAGLLRMMDAIRSFDTIYVMTKGGPSNYTETLSFLTYKTGFMFFDMGMACALSYVLLLIVLTLSQVLTRAKVFKVDVS